jgi:hypothetical protein
MAEKINLNTGWKLHFDPINNQPETFNTIESFLQDTFKVNFKGGSDNRNNHGLGKSYTAYPQSLEERDRLIAAIHKDNKISALLAPVSPVEGNMPFTDKLSGRFTTGYNVTDQDGKINWSHNVRHNPQEAFESKKGKNYFIKDSWNSPGENKLKGFINLRSTADEISEDIGRMKSTYPAVHELMVGKPGYNSPYPLHLPGINRTQFKRSQDAQCWFSNGNKNKC